MDIEFSENIGFDLVDSKSHSSWTKKKIRSATIWVFPKIGVPPKHPKKIIFSRKLLGTTILGNPQKLFSFLQFHFLRYFQAVNGKESQGL